LIQFNGSLSSWWTKIVIGLLTLGFIGVQSLLNQSRFGMVRKQQLTGDALVTYQRKRRLRTVGAVAGVAILALAWIFMPKLGITGGISPTEAAGRCELQPYRQDQAAALVDDGAVIVYERNGGPECIDELYAIHPDGRIVR
jgi:hypothetical protein